jgi:hypothetical protein
MNELKNKEVEAILFINDSYAPMVNIYKYFCPGYNSSAGASAKYGCSIMQAQKKSRCLAGLFNFYLRKDYFTLSITALNACGSFKAKSASTLRFNEIPDLLSLPIN